MWPIFIISVLVVNIAAIVFLQWMGIIPSRFPLFHYDSEKIILKRRKGLQRQVSWQEIKAITTCYPVKSRMEDYHNFTFSLENGRRINFVIATDVKETLGKLYDNFLSSLMRRHYDIEKINFSFPGYWLRKRTSISLLKVHDNSIGWSIHSKEYSKAFSEVVNCTMDKTRGIMVFADGVRLDCLENISYWPLLREYLISKLESSNMSESK